MYYLILDYTTSKNEIPHVISTEGRNLITPKERFLVALLLEMTQRTTNHSIT